MEEVLKTDVRFCLKSQTRSSLFLDLVESVYGCPLSEWTPILKGKIEFTLE